MAAELVPQFINEVLKMIILTEQEKMIIDAARKGEDKKLSLMTLLISSEPLQTQEPASQETKHDTI